MGNNKATFKRGPVYVVTDANRIARGAFLDKSEADTFRDERRTQGETADTRIATTRTITLGQKVDTL